MCAARYVFGAKVINNNHFGNTLNSMDFRLLLRIFLRIAKAIKLFTIPISKVIMCRQAALLY